MRISSILLAASTAAIVHASVSCLKVGATATASWTNSAGKACSWSGAVGSNFGTNAGNGGDYSCNGRCGAGCSGTALGNYYTQDCFSHDICSWFNNASGGASDPNCGAAYTAAEDDYLWGGIDGCSQTNPSLAASAPKGTPVCV
ncbi:hydrolytic enzyme protein [Rutstroemia sp. NJR-2017a BBW]|nr:hydrolytic enzyme protein [Rutstroemia sp. NJR-2017a BBW]